MIDGRSNLLASELGDIFARLGWHRAGFTAMATESATAVAVQYRSPKFGAVRVVSCDALGVARWLKLHAVKPGCRADDLGLRWEVKTNFFIEPTNGTVTSARTAKA